jgi:hypothetical protein
MLSFNQVITSDLALTSPVLVNAGQLTYAVAVHVGVTGTAQELSNITVLRSSLLVTRAEFGDRTVIESAHRTFASEAATVAERRMALSIVAAHADAATFDFLLERARNTDDPLEKEHILEALGAVSDPVLARKMVDIGLGDQIPAGFGPTIIEKKRPTRVSIPQLRHLQQRDIRRRRRLREGAQILKNLASLLIRQHRF